MLAIAVMVGSWLLASAAHSKMGIKPDDIYDLAFWVVLSGMLGARLFYVLLNLDYFAASPLEIIMVQKGGLAWQGSLVAGLGAAILYIKSKNWPLFTLLDLAAPYIALGHAIGRIGCLLNGCCYGKAAAWGLYFPVWQTRLVPTQVFMSLGQLAIFLVLRTAQSKARRGGQIFVWYLLLSAAERFTIEFFRADHDVYWGLSIFQYVCIGIFITALAVNFRLERR